MSELPARSPAAEDAYIQTLAEQSSSNEASDEVLADAVRAAVRAGRPQLAARLVGLLGSHDPDDPELERARRAARLLCIEPQSAAQLEALDEALSQLQRRRVARFKQRSRDRMREQARPVIADPGAQAQRWRRHKRR